MGRRQTSQTGTQLRIITFVDLWHLISRGRSLDLIPSSFRFVCSPSPSLHPGGRWSHMEAGLTLQALWATAGLNPGSSGCPHAAGRLNNVAQHLLVEMLGTDIATMF